MKKWLDRTKKHEYIRRQSYILSNLGLFYLIIIALFGIPLLGTFVVVLIKGVIGLQYFIIPLAMLILGLAIVYGLRGLRRLKRQVHPHGQQMMDAAEKGTIGSNPIQISILNGLFSLSYGKSAAPLERSCASRLKPSKQLSLSPPPPHDVDGDVLGQLKELAALRKAGDIDDQEFERLKARLIENACGN